MAAVLTINVDSADVEDFFTGLASRATDPQDCLGYVGKDMVAKFRDNIDQESGGPNLPGWADLSKSRVEQRKRHGLGGSHPMLKGETGDLYAHLVSTITGSESVSAGTDGELVYPAVHDIGEGNMPQRSFIWLDDERVEGWVEVLMQFLLEATPPPEAA
jgi:hypothetical protein